MDKQDKQLQTLAQNIAKHLEGWTYRQSKHKQTEILTAPSGATIVMSFGSIDKTRIYIRGEYPIYNGRVYLPVNNERAAITVSASKSSEQITKDISRRFLPQYTKEYEEALEFVRMRTEYDNRITQVASELQALIPGSELSMKDDKEYLRIYTDTYCGEIEPNCSFDNTKQTTIDIKLRRLPLETAKGMLRALTINSQEIM